MMGRMSEWSMSWGDGDDPAPLLPADQWEPAPVPPGATRAVVVTIEGFHNLPIDPLIVAWDDLRATVRSVSGRLQWYEDRTHEAYPDAQRIVTSDSGVYPRDNRHMDALAVRSLLDLIETINADEVTSIDDDGTIHVRGLHDDSWAELTRSESGVVVRASGAQGVNAWRLHVTRERLLTDDDRLLAPQHVEPPAI